MTPDPKYPDVLLSVANEIEAAAIATALADYDIQAMTLGGYISGFKAEAPGNVAVVVKRADFDRAKQALTEIRRQQGQLEWSKVDVMESAEVPTAVEEEDGARSVPSLVVRLFWMMELLGIAVCFFVWLFTRQLTPLLTCTAAGLVLIGLFLALSPFVARRY